MPVVLEGVTVRDGRRGLEGGVLLDGRDLSTWIEYLLMSRL